MAAKIASRKRTLDLFLALCLCLPAIVVCCLAAMIIWAEDRRNPFFLQRRIGRNGLIFQVFKLRTMRVGVGDLPSHETPVASITRTGMLLRKSKLDELPQIWNVLRGEMSFVGPRPGLPSQVCLAKFRKELGVDRLVPGVTGLAQVQGIDMSEPERLAKADAKYLGDWSLSLDLQILFKTIFGAGYGDAANKRLTE